MLKNSSSDSPYVSSLASDSKLGQVTARALVYDSDIEPINRLLKSDVGHLFDHENVLFHRESCDGQYSMAHYCQAYTVKNSFSRIDKVIEACTSPNPIIIMFYAMCGGTGGGWAALINSYIVKNFPEIPMIQIQKWPDSGKEESSVVAPYNMVLGVHNNLETAK